MHTCQCICHVNVCSFVPSSVLRDTGTSASVRGLCSFAFCCVHSWTCTTSACFELAVVSLCNQCPHAHGSLLFVFCDVLCLGIVFGLSPPISTVYIISVWWVPFSPSMRGVMAGLPGFASQGAVSCRSWLPIVKAPEHLGTHPKLSDAVVNAIKRSQCGHKMM